MSVWPWMRRSLFQSVSPCLTNQISGYLSSHAVNHETDCLSTVQLAGKPVPTFPVARPVSPCLHKPDFRVQRQAYLSCLQAHVRGIGVLHADDVIAGIDVQDFSGHAAAHVGEEISPGFAHFIYGDGAAHGRVVFVPLENVAEVADAGGRQRLDGAGGDGVDADVLLAKVSRQIAHRGLECGLGNTHDVIVRHPLFSAIIGQRQKRAAVGHQFLCALCNGGERVARNVQRAVEVVFGGVDIASGEFILVGKRNGMNHEVQLAPLLLDFCEGSIHRGGVGDIALKHDVRAEFLCQRLDAFAQRLTLVGERQFSTMTVGGLCNAPRNGPVVGNAHYKPALAGHD
jgi:hypothetical protein